MGFSYIIAGLVFFFLPNVNIIDVLPDFIGCILIMAGLNKTADLVPALENAKDSFKNVLYYTLAKFAVSFFAPMLSNSDPTTLLLFTFVFSVFDFIFLIPAFRKLLDGMTYLGDRTNSKVIFVNNNTLQKVTIAFLTLRTVLSLIPEFSAISSPEQSPYITAYDPRLLSNYKTLLTFTNLLIVSVFGCVWFIMSVRYFSRIRKDKTLIGFLKQQYAEKILPNKSLFIRRKTAAAFGLILAAALFMYDVAIDYINILPDFIMGLFILLAAFTLRRHCKIKPLTITAALYTAFSLVFYIISVNYALKFPYGTLMKNFKAYEQFVRLNILNVIQHVLLAALLIGLYLTVAEIINKYTNTMSHGMPSDNERNAEKKKRLRTFNTLSLAFGMLTVVSGIARTALTYSFPVYWLIDILIMTVYFSLLGKSLSEIKRDVEYDNM